MKIEVLSFECELKGVPDWVSYELEDRFFDVSYSFDLDALAIEIGERLTVDYDNDDIEVFIYNIEWVRVEDKELFIKC